MLSEGFILTVTAATLVIVAGLLTYMLVSSILRERRSARIRRTWANFGLSIAFATLFFVSWMVQALAEWGAYQQEQRAHGEPTDVGDYLVQFGQSTLENWQSEFLQLFAFVVFSAILIHHGSAESRDSDDRMEKKIDEIARRLDELQPSPR